MAIMINNLTKDEIKECIKKLELIIERDPEKEETIFLNDLTYGTTLEAFKEALVRINQSEELEEE